MNLLTFPNPLLKRRSMRVRLSEMDQDEYAIYEKYSPEDVKGMKELLAQIPNGLALAANQVGLRGRLFVVRPEFAKENGLQEVIINPEWHPIRSDETQVDSEGCLSFPGLSLDIDRFWMIDISYDHEDGTNSAGILTGLAARMFQHECEHLDGETFLENLPRIQRYQVAANYKKSRGK